MLLAGFPNLALYVHNFRFYYNILFGKDCNYNHLSKIRTINPCLDFSVYRSVISFRCAWYTRATRMTSIEGVYFNATKIARAETLRTRRSSREHKDRTVLRSSPDLLTDSFNECDVGWRGYILLC